jgi:glycosyltransferase involved in cell wall biosynthesis
MQPSSRAKIAVLYPAFLGGGAEAVGLWILQALQDQYDLTLYTVSDLGFDRLNAMYGTTISSDRVAVRSLFPQSWLKTINTCIANQWHFRMFVFHRLIAKLKAERSEFATCISAYNAVDFGQPLEQGPEQGAGQGLTCINYIHWINVLDSNRFYNKLSDTQPSRVKTHRNLANSKMVSGKVQEAYGCEPTLVYPPVVIDVQDIPWEEKEYSFICSGRLTLPKEPHKVIEILTRVRDRGFKVKLEMTGGGGGIYASGYLKRIKAMVAERTDWITLHEDLSYQDYVNVLSKCRYGIHYKTEPFGISIAEMIKAGAIPFVRSFGGQVEIVGEHHEDLFFFDPDAAVETICKVLGDEQRQAELQDSLKIQQQLFSTERFMGEIQQVVAEYLGGDSGSGNGTATAVEIALESCIQ